MNRLPPPPRARRVLAWRAVLAVVAVLLFGLAALTRSWALVILACAPAFAAALLESPSRVRRGGL